MNPNEPRIPIFSAPTSLGTWLVSTDAETMRISSVTYGFAYYLTNSRFPEFELSSDRNVYDLILAVAQHRTGLPDWDNSRVRVSDDTRDWTAEHDDRLLINLVAEFLRLRSHDSMRDMVDYFEHKHGYFMDRMKIKDLLQQLILTGEIAAIPSMHLAPSEMKSLQGLANKWLDSEMVSSLCKGDG